jgi:hypothetical protein
MYVTTFYNIWLFALWQKLRTVSPSHTVWVTHSSGWRNPSLLTLLTKPAWCTWMTGLVCQIFLEYQRHTQPCDTIPLHSTPSSAMLVRGNLDMAHVCLSAPPQSSLKDATGSCKLHHWSRWSPLKGLPRMAITCFNGIFNDSGIFHHDDCCFVTRLISSNGGGYEVWVLFSPFLKHSTNSMVFL